MGSRVRHSVATHCDTTMGKGQNEGGFSQEQLDMYKDCFKLMDINKDGTIDKNDLRGAFDNVGVLMTEVSLTVCLERSTAPAPTRTWSTCSRRRWPETATTPTTWSSRPSRPTTSSMIDVKMFQHALKTWG